MKKKVAALSLFSRGSSMEGLNRKEEKKQAPTVSGVELTCLSVCWMMVMMNTGSEPCRRASGLTAAGR